MEKGQRITEITLIDEKTDEVSIHLEAKIDGEGNLVLEGQDIGKFVENYWGDSDYEYWLRIDRDDKDTVLLWLIKERFSMSSEFRMSSDFRTWLDAKGIPSQFWSWT